MAANSNSLPPISSATISASSVNAAQPASAQSNSTTVTAIVNNFRELIKDTKGLDEAANYLYQTLLDDAVAGIFIETHHLRKTGNLAALDGVAAEDNAESAYRICEMPNLDIFGISTAKKPMDCNCPNCDRLVAAARFAPHLEKCMGMGRISSRIASRRLATATKEGTSASSSSSSTYLHSGGNTGGTDDEDDVDWSSDKRKKKSSQNSRNNGSKKNNGKTF